MKRNAPKCLISAALALAIITLPSLPSTVFAATDDLESRQEELNQRKESLEQQSQELDDKLRDVRSKKEEKEEYKKTLEEKISVVQEQISVASQRIEQLDDEINEASAKISDKQTEIESSYDLLKKRLCNIYMAGETSTLDIILGSKSMRDFLDKAEMLHLIAQHDKKLIDDLDSQVKDIQQQRDEISLKREEVANEKTTLDAKKAELSDLKAENDRIILDLQEDEKQTQEQRQSVQNEMDRYMEEFMEWQKEYEESLISSEPEPEPSTAPHDTPSKPSGGGNTGNSSGGGTSSKPGGGNTGTSSGGGTSSKPDGGGSQPSGGLYGWPVPGFYTISSYYGNRPQYGYHKGIDIAGPNIFRATIVAVEDGVVTKVNRTDEWGGGWGYHVIIRHPDGNSTLYAHCDQIVNGLSVGQKVSRGQPIGYVGETGDAYGVHLHFEVWKDSQYGQRVDPLPYLPH